ncbi:MULTISPECIES: hypothetical protein [unclassified Sphingomonas]|uniref:hypothetical protein n=1 Tax=unclassified Sphingomonas TaxID=196159 RepID=UPI002269E9DE|nr:MULTISPECIES: hypothetical protein [unclassified Sphingomonas]
MIDMSSGHLWYDCDAGSEVTAFPSRVYTTGVTFGRDAYGRGPIRGAAPGGIGGKVRTMLTAPHNNAFGSIIGDGTPAAMLFTTTPGASYRVVVTGQIRAVSNGGGESPGVGFAA